MHQKLEFHLDTDKNGYQSIMFHKNEPEDRLYASRIIIQDFHRRLLFSTESSIKLSKLHLYSKFILKYISDIFTLPLIQNMLVQCNSITLSETSTFLYP